MTAQPKRPRREKKGDRLLNPDATRAQIQCDYGVAPLDRVANEYDRKWGIERLPELVSTDTAEKYGFSIGKLNEAITATDPEQTKAWAAVCIRGLHAMDAEATRLGAKPASGKYLEYELEDEHGGEPFRMGILFDDKEWQTAQDERPDLKFFTLREAAIALRTKMDTGPVAEVKKAFPGAQVVEHRRTPLEEALNDHIPFAPETRT